MSTDVNDWRASRRADRLADREANREDLKATAEERRKDADAARRRAAAERREAEERKSKRRAARAAKWGKVTGWVTDNPARAFVRLVQACSIVPAVISQVTALGNASVELLLAALLATMLEGTAWALVAMGAAAEREGKPARVYRVGAWLAGAVAAAINLAHGLDAYKAHPWVAVVLALSSLVAVWLTDLQTHAGHRPTRAERRRVAAEKKAAEEKAAAELAAAEEKAKAEQAAIDAHRERRKEHEPEVFELTQRLLSAAPLGKLDEDDAWRTAWEYVKGIGTPGLTAEMLAGRNAARARVAEHSALPAPVDLLGPGRPEDPFPALTLPLLSGPSDSVYVDTVPEALAAPWRAISEEPETLGGIGREGSDDPAQDVPGQGEKTAPGKTSAPAAGNTGKALDPEHLAKVRDLADLFASANRTISTSDVKKLLGGGRNEYLVRLRQQVEAERAERGEQ
ncbi:DUF2637 domain-containing protein [Kitasatospora purpeofusca]|uniref:DUF2637 domain-containing protein n=1 Tax=Kitasatospora purpeofusca TaxID=67352 RepID=UPI003804CE4F